MTPAERRFMTRLMIVASVLVATLVAVTLWLTFQEPDARPSPAASQPGEP